MTAHNTKAVCFKVFRNGGDGALQKMFTAKKEIHLTKNCNQRYVLHEGHRRIVRPDDTVHLYQTNQPIVTLPPAPPWATAT